MASLNFDQLNADSKGQLACTLASLILTDNGKATTCEALNEILEASNVKVPAYWSMIFGNSLVDKNVKDLLSGSSAQSGSNAATTAAPAAAEEKAPVKEEKKEEVVEEEVDLGDFDLFG